MLEEFLQIVLLALSVSTLSLLLSKSHLGMFLQMVLPKIQVLLGCHFCLNFWIAGGLMIYYWPISDWFIIYCSIVGMATIFNSFIISNMAIAKKEQWR